MFSGRPFFFNTDAYTSITFIAANNQLFYAYIFEHKYTFPLT